MPPEHQLFCITGYSHEHLAWLSSFLSYGTTSICIHDPFIRGIDLGYFNQGYIYTGLAQSQMHIQADFKKWRVVWVDTYADLSPPKEFRNHPQGLYLGSDRTEAQIKAVWEFCLPTTRFPHERYLEERRKQIIIQGGAGKRKDPELDEMLNLVCHE